jgi:ANTAR domain-containing protein
MHSTLPELVEARGHIEQAKGALMLVYGITAEHAFAVLQWRSQETNTKLRVPAGKLTVALTTLGGGPLQQRTQFDHLLLTIHQHPDPPTTSRTHDPRPSPKASRTDSGHWRARG